MLVFHTYSALAALACLTWLGAALVERTANRGHDAPSAVPGNAR